MFKKLATWFSFLFKSERGSVNIGGTLMMGIGMVFLAVGFIMFPIATTATDSILGYNYTANWTIADNNMTGLDAIVGITPILILLGFISAAVVSGFLGIKIMKEGGGANISPGNLMLLGLSIVFIAVGLIMFPVVLDGVASVWHGGGEGLNAAYTGLQPILLMSPMLVLISFLAGAVITGFFGIKSIAKAG